jgi:hypothetical protein
MRKNAAGVAVYMDLGEHVMKDDLWVRFVKNRQEL